MKTSMKLRTHAMVLLGFLGLQYILGMLANLFVAFPEGGSENLEWEFAKSQFYVMAHIVLGLLLLLGALALVVRAFKQKDRNWMRVSIIGIIAILLAIVYGSTFISKQLESYSFNMALLFLVAVASNVWGIHKDVAKD